LIGLRKIVRENSESFNIQNQSTQQVRKSISQEEIARLAAEYRKKMEMTEEAIKIKKIESKSISCQDGYTLNGDKKCVK
jgi:predicted metal-dependent hydrolase